MTETLSVEPTVAPAAADPRRLYCDLLGNALTRYAFGETYMPYRPRPHSWRGRAYRQVHRLLRPGALFKFQVQGHPSVDSSPDDTWHGVSFNQEQATAMARRCGFEHRHSHGEGSQYFWLWFFKPPA